jgi:hypothetical protein
MLQKVLVLITLSCFAGKNLAAAMSSPPETVIQKDLVVVGAGIVGLMEVYYAHRHAVQNKQQPLRVDVFEKGSSLLASTACHIAPSLTCDEVLSVVPRGDSLVKAMSIPFHQPGGIYVNISSVIESLAARRFLSAANGYGYNRQYSQHTQSLLQLGKVSMEEWDRIYREADPVLKDIFRRSNYSPSLEVAADEKALGKGYRVDVLYEIPEALAHASRMRDTYQQQGYLNSRILTPEQTVDIDPSLADFVTQHSHIVSGERVWHSNSVALWRPGGRLDAKVFIPEFAKYLQSIMGSCESENKQKQNCLQFHFYKEAVKAQYAMRDGQWLVESLQFKDGTFFGSAAHSYVFAPGEAVGTLEKLGFHEPASAAFAGSSLTLKIPLSDNEIDFYRSFNHAMEVHKVGIVLAWQARLMDAPRNKHIKISVGGTKAFYGSGNPLLAEHFAQNRHTLQLQMIVDVLPQILEKFVDVKRPVRFDDVESLEKKGLLTRWVGKRAVAYDGIPTMGRLYANFKNRSYVVANARCTTHLGSGGVSFAPAAVLVSRQDDLEPALRDSFAAKILDMSSSMRRQELIDDVVGDH